MSERGWMPERRVPPPEPKPVPLRARAIIFLARDSAVIGDVETVKAELRAQLDAAGLGGVPFVLLQGLDVVVLE